MLNSNRVSLIIGISGFSEWLNPEQTVETGVQVQVGTPWLIPIFIVFVCVKRPRGKMNKIADLL